MLERHLVISDKAFTMADLRSMGNESIVLPTIRDALTIRVREDGKRKYSRSLNIEQSLKYNNYFEAYQFSWYFVNIRRTFALNTVGLHSMRHVLK